MRQKTTLMCFLMLGSSIILGSIITSCSTEMVDDFMEGKWCFVNESDHKIEVQSEDYLYNFTLEASQSHSFKTGSTIGPSDVDETAYLAPYTSGDKIIVDDGPAHVLVANEGISNRSNYKSKKIERNNYRFTYVFTNENIAELTKPEKPAEPEEPAAVDK